MDFRPGLCSACKASFRIPATFTANKAKCSKCGGTVEIGAVVSGDVGATPPASSAPPVPAKAIAAPVAAAAARLAAKPESSSAKPAATPAKPAAAPAKPAVPHKPISAPAKPAATVAKPAAPVAKTPAASATTKPGTTAKPAAKAAPAALGKAKPVAARASHAAEAEEHDGETREERRARLEKKKGLSPVLLGVSALLSVGVLGGVWVVYQKTSKEKAAAEKIAADADAARKEQLRKDAAERERLAAEALKAAEPEKPATGEVLAAEAPVKQEEAAKPAPVAKGPVEGFDLSTIPDFGPAEGTSDEEWTELQSLAALFMDASAGARASRAGTKLMETPKKSFPAILNQFKKLDLESEDGYRNADATQKLLERICKGHNVGWKYEQQENWLQYNQKAIKKWCDLWTKASTDEAFWNGLIKADSAKKDEEGAAADGAPPPKKVDDF